MFSYVERVSPEVGALPRSTPLNPAASAALPVDFTAILAAIQDQIDDLTATVAAHQRRLEELTAPGSTTAGR